jgi:hypothetical protein
MLHDNKDHGPMQFCSLRSYCEDTFNMPRTKVENYLSLHIKILSLYSVTILLSVTCLPFPKLQSLCFDCKFSYIKLQSYPLIILLILYNCYPLLGWFYIASFILSSSYALFYLHFI